MHPRSNASRRRSAALLLTTAWAAIAATPALAQSSVGSLPASTVEEVTVTAQKRAEDVQRVPLSVTPISAATIERLHVQDAKDLTAIVPNVQVQVNAAVALAASYVIRGIGIANNPSPYVGTEVGTVVDGVVMSNNSLGLVDQFDVERIEVLRGPQGTLFGANTTGGVINIVLRQPTGEFGGYGTVTAGNYKRLDAQVGVNFPIVEGLLAGKIAFSHRGRDGFYTNLYNGEKIGGINSDTLRGYLLLTPNEDLDVTLSYDVQKIRNGQDILHPLSYTGQTFFRPGTPTREFKIYSDVPDSTKANIHGATLTANWKSPFGDVTAITNYRDYRRVSNQDLDGVNANLFNQAGIEFGIQTSQELRTVLHPTDSIEVLLGGFFQHWNYGSQGLTEPVYASPTTLGLGFAKLNNTNYSGFTQVYWDVTDRFRLQGGARVTWEQVRVYRANVSYTRPGGSVAALGLGNLIGAIQLPINPANLPSGGQDTWTNIGWKIGADYKVTDDVMAYGYYARGFKSGGFNARVSRSQDIGPYDPEYVDTFEGGVKSTFLENRLRLNVSAFLNKWKDMQVAQSIFSGNPPVGSALILNAGKATTKGIEIEAEFVPVTGLRLNGSLGLLRTNYDKFVSGNGAPCPPLPAAQPVGCSAVYTGRELSYSPKVSGTISATYSFPLAGGMTDATLQYSYNGRRWGSFTQTDVERMGPVDLFNGNISWKPVDGNWGVSLWGRNILDKRYVAMSLNVPPLFTEGVLGNPRQFGIDFTFDF